MPLLRHGFKARHFLFPRRSGGPLKEGAERTDKTVNMNYKTIIAVACASAALYIGPALAQEEAEEQVEAEEEVEEAKAKPENEWKKFGEMGPGVYRVKLVDDGSMKSCIIVGQARISKALGKAKGLMDAKKVAKQNAEAAFIAFLKVHVSDVRQTGDATEIHITGVDEDGDPIEEANSTETKSQITTSQAEAQLRGMSMLSSDLDGENETLTQIFGWKPAFAAASAGAAGAMNTKDAAPGKAAPTGIDGSSEKKGGAENSGSGTGSSGNGKKKIKIKSKTTVTKGAEEFL